MTIHLPDGKELFIQRLVPALQEKEKSSCRERDKESGRRTPSSSSNDGPPCLQVRHVGCGSHTMPE